MISFLFYRDLSSSIKRRLPQTHSPFFSATPPRIAAVNPHTCRSSVTNDPASVTFDLVVMKYLDHRTNSNRHSYQRRENAGTKGKRARREEGGGEEEGEGQVERSSFLRTPDQSFRNS
jgi:hypothetical protein